MNEAVGSSNFFEPFNYVQAKLQHSAINYVLKKSQVLVKALCLF